MKRLSMKNRATLPMLFLMAFPVTQAVAEEGMEMVSIGNPGMPAEEALAATASLDFGIGEEVDPYVRSQVHGLRASGLMPLQSEIGTDLMMIDRFQRRALALEQMMSALGTEGLRQFDPNLYASLEKSPIFIRQRIAELNLERELEEAALGGAIKQDGMAMGPDGPFNIFDHPPFAPGPIAYAPPEAPEQQSVSEAPAETSETEEPQIDLLEQMLTAVETAPRVEDIPISLREILGANGVYRAVILHGDELIRVEVGDMLPNDTEIMGVYQDRIEIRRRDDVVNIHFRG